MSKFAEVHISGLVLAKLVSHSTVTIWCCSLIGIYALSIILSFFNQSLNLKYEISSEYKEVRNAYKAKIKYKNQQSAIAPNTS